MVSGFLKVCVVTVLIINFAFGQNLKIGGASTIQPIIEDLSSFYTKLSGLPLIISGGGSSTGIQGVLNGFFDVGMVSRELTPIEKETISYVNIGFDALVMIVNIQNPLSDITKQDIYHIYNGNIKNWNQFGWENAPIIPISKEYGRGSLEVFEKYIELKNPDNPSIKDKQIRDDVWLSKANNDILVWVGGIKNTIGFVSYGNAIDAIAQGMPIKILSIDKIKPNATSIKSGVYPMSRQLYLVYKKDNYKSQQFTKWLLEDFAQQCVKEHHFIGINDE